MRRDKDRFNINISTNLLNSDFMLESLIEIKNIFPFKSKSFINIHSEHLNIGLISYSLLKVMDSLYHDAYIEKKGGYEDMYFLDRPIGKFINDNNIKLKYSVTNLELGKGPC